IISKIYSLSQSGRVCFYAARLFYEESSVKSIHYLNQAGFAFMQPGFFMKKLWRKTTGKKEKFSINAVT
ncbi:hypothetical protein, partial [Escherichia coli]|uniref:hypothetical protein n=1 Tax=Escherichia coli TaxID=562 RepID=UPI001A93700A